MEKALDREVAAVILEPIQGEGGSISRQKDTWSLSPHSAKRTAVT